MCMHLCECMVFALERSKDGVRVTGVTGIVSCLMLVLGAETRSPRRTVSALNHRVISLAPNLNF